MHSSFPRVAVRVNEPVQVMCLAQYLEHGKWPVNVVVIIGIPTRRTELLSPACEGGVRAPSDRTSNVSSLYSASHSTEPPPTHMAFPPGSQAPVCGACICAGAGALVLPLFYQQPIAKQPGQRLHQLPPALCLLRLFLW